MWSASRGEYPPTPTTRSLKWARYRSSESILSALYEKELSGHLKGAIILIHVGTDPRRKDKLYDQLEEIIQKLKAKGYAFERVDRHVE